MVPPPEQVLVPVVPVQELPFRTPFAPQVMVPPRQVSTSLRTEPELANELVPPVQRAAPGVVPAVYSTVHWPVPGCIAYPALHLQLVFMSVGSTTSWFIKQV